MELYTPVLALALLAAGFAIFSVVMSALVGPKRYNRAKVDSYECGIEPTPQPVGGGRFPVKYYITAMLFIVFDIEIIFLYPWAVQFDALRALRPRRDGPVHRHRLRRVRLCMATRRPGLGLRAEMHCTCLRSPRSTTAPLRSARRSPSLVGLGMHSASRLSTGCR